MKVIFFDIEGVLNSNKFMCSHPDELIDQKNVDNMATIVKSTAAKLVLTCDWRSEVMKQPVTNAGAKELLEKLENAGLDIYGVLPDESEIVGKCDDYGRNFQIKEYLRQTSVEGFVIIDDMDLDWESVGLGEHWINTENVVNGLTAEDAQTAINILNLEK